MKVPNSKSKQYEEKYYWLTFRCCPYFKKNSNSIQNSPTKKNRQQHINIIYRPTLHVNITYLLVRHPFHGCAIYLYWQYCYWSVSRQNHQKLKAAVQQYNPFQEESFTHLSGILRRMPVELSSVALACPKLAFYWWSGVYEPITNRKLPTDRVGQVKAAHACYGLYVVRLITSSWMGVVSQFWKKSAVTARS